VSDDEPDTYHLVCTPVDSDMPHHIRGAVQRACSTCGAQVWVSPSSLPYVQREGYQPTCIWHKPPADSRFGGIQPDQALELWNHGVTQEQMRNGIANAEWLIDVLKRYGN
jgi:hypothetical protein